jgi:hypothetical protein
MNSLVKVPWPYWVLALATIITAVVSVRSTGVSLCLNDCEECGEPLGSNDEVCGTCYEALEGTSNGGYLSESLTKEESVDWTQREMAAEMKRRYDAGRSSTSTETVERSRLRMGA